MRHAPIMEQRHREIIGRVTMLVAGLALLAACAAVMRVGIPGEAG